MLLTSFFIASHRYISLVLPKLFDLHLVSWLEVVLKVNLNSPPGTISSEPFAA